MRILHAADFVVQPWKNGAGMTTEIMASPAGAGFDRFDWRVSMAQVAAPGPFSMFSGIDRSLGVLAGDGIVLVVDGRGEVELKPGAHPAVFPGDVPVEARLTGGPILDLNVMTRRGRWRHHLSRTSIIGAFKLERRGDVTLALVRGSSGTVDDRPLCDGDAVLLEAGDDSVQLFLRATCDLWIADLWQLLETR